MDQQAWNILNTAIAAIAAIAGAIAAWAAIRVYRKQVDGEYPTVSASFQSGALILRVENNTPVEWTIDRLLIPSRTVGNLAEHLIAYDNEGNITQLSGPEELSKMLSDAIPIGYAIMPTGSGVSSGGSRYDVAQARVHLRTSRKSLSMRLILLSSDALQRTKEIDIKRTAPESIMIATD
ncbi:hypothetical protein [Sphingobium sp.]|uniref:hypothetical protein n=1 Tax=Sphingobium sp. TaxID=1912891 RepID=UPI000DB28D5B|nr:hypothetical protein [Sphingobium sp.]PZU65241.1 MAG: hypothetical protein DI540_17895 [Sphingobium sp.]